MSENNAVNKGGRPKAGTSAQIMLAKALWHDYSFSNDAICEMTKMNYRTLYRRLGKRNIKTGKKLL